MSPFVLAGYQLQGEKVQAVAELKMLHQLGERGGGQKDMFCMQRVKDSIKRGLGWGRSMPCGPGELLLVRMGNPDLAGLRNWFRVRGLGVPVE